MYIKIYKKLYIVLWTLVIVVVYQLHLKDLSFFSTLQNKITDILFNHRYRHDALPKEAKEIVLVALDDESFKEIIRSQPFDRKIYSKILEKILSCDQQPRIIAMDVSFAGESSNPQDDIELARELQKNNNIVIASHFDKNNVLILPQHLFIEAADGVGFVNLPRDEDFIIRRMYPFKMIKNRGIGYPFTTEIFALLKGIDLKHAFFDRKQAKLILPAFSGNFNYRKDFFVPVDPLVLTTKINYFVQLEDFKVIPFKTLLQSPELKENLQDKIVMIGSTMELLHDVYPTPFGTMSGIVVNANILSMLFSQRFLRELSWTNSFFLLFLVTLIAGFATARLSNVRSLFVIICILFSNIYMAGRLIHNDIIYDTLGFIFLPLLSYLGIIVLRYISLFIENRQLRILAITDELTGLFVFRYLKVKLESDIRKALEQQYSLSLVMFDIDNFKKFNDTYGHEAGNLILSKVALLIKNNSRPSDTVFRFGGDEFITILFNTNLANSIGYADKIRKIVENSSFSWKDNILKVTISAGGSSLSDSRNKVPRELFTMADEALYKAKSSGKNIVCEYKLP